MNAVNPKADENLLELMVKIAENPQEWQNIHAILREYSPPRTNTELSARQPFQSLRFKPPRLLIFDRDMTYRYVNTSTLEAHSTLNESIAASRLPICFLNVGHLLKATMSACKPGASTVDISFNSHS